MIAHVLHLPDRTDRLENIKRQAEWQGFEFMLHEGMRGEPVHTYISRSHKNIIRYAKEQGLPEVLVMEDDISFKGDGAFQDFLAHKPNNYDIFLGGTYGRDFKRDKTIRTFRGLHLYIVNSRFYDKFLGVTEKEHIDVALGGLGRYILYDVARQTDGYSDNIKRYVNYNNFVK